MTRLRRPVLWVSLVAVLVAATFLLVVREDPAAPRAAAEVDLAAEVRDFAAGLEGDAPYRPPSPAQRRQLLSVLRALAAGESTAGADDIGYTIRTGTDATTGRRFGLAVNAPDERAWGWYLIDLSTPTRLAIEVPHPNFDLHTEELGIALFRKVPGSVLAVAGTHRRAGDDDAGDVAHHTDSMFHAVAQDFAIRGLPQLQLHGFHDDSLPDADVVLSPGAGDDGPLVRATAQRLTAANFEVCRSWREDCGRLEGKTNEQGRDAEARDTPFLHVELSRTIRDDRSRWPALVGALAVTE